MVRAYGEARSNERQVVRDARTEGVGGVGEEVPDQLRTVGLPEAGAPPRFCAASWTPNSNSPAQVIENLEEQGQGMMNQLLPHLINLVADPQPEVRYILYANMMRLKHFWQ